MSKELAEGAPYDTYSDKAAGVIPALSLGMGPALAVRPRTENSRLGWGRALATAAAARLFTPKYRKMAAR